MNRHPEDKPILIKSKKEFIDFFNEEMNWWELRTGKDPYEVLGNYVEHPQEYPCMLYFREEDVDFTPGWDFHLHFFYLEDARELYVAKFLGE